MAIQVEANLNVNVDASSSVSPFFNQCQGTACFIFARLIRGTTVSVMGDSGTPYGPTTFVEFNPKNCGVTLRETDNNNNHIDNVNVYCNGTTHLTTTVIDCNKIESISFIS